MFVSYCIPDSERSAACKLATSRSETRYLQNKCLVHIGLLMDSNLGNSVVLKTYRQSTASLKTKRPSAELGVLSLIGAVLACTWIELR